MTSADGVLEQFDDIFADDSGTVETFAPVQQPAHSQTLLTTCEREREAERQEATGQAALLDELPYTLGQEVKQLPHNTAHQITSHGQLHTSVERKSLR